MELFFFIPGTRLYKVSDIQNLKISQIIIDLEDAVKISERKCILEELLKTDDFKDFYIRIPLYDSKGNLDASFFAKLYKQGFRKFVFPKIQKSLDFETIISGFNDKDLRIILLVETCRFFLEVKDILLEYSNIITGIGLGSHDFMNEVGGLHDLRNLEYIRQHIIYLARMINVKAIDIASMELNNSTILEEEIIDGFHKGYDAKFFIHPWQVSVFKTISLYSEQEIAWALNVQKELDKVENDGEFNPVVIEGQIIERPHLNKVKKILKYYESK